jgi:hypothetical protein
MSCTNRAPFIDSITARTRRPAKRAARPRKPSASAGTAVSATSLPRASTKQISS